jgi:hypothetical protein
MAEDQTRSHLSASGANRLRRAIGLLLIVVFLSIIAMRGTFLWWRHEEVMLDSRRQAESLALVLSKHFEQTIATVDAALSQLALHAKGVGGANAQPPFWDPVLEASFAGLAGVGSLSVVNDRGQITHSTVPAAVGQMRDDQFIFRHFSSVSSNDLLADAPYRSIVDGRMLIPLGRRLARPDGSFDGAIVATLDPSQLRTLYRSVEIGPGSIISVLHPTGIVLFREPSNGDPIGNAAFDDPLLTAPRDEFGNGFLRHQFKPGGPFHLSAHRSLSKPHVLLAVSLSEDDVLATWRNELWTSVLGVGAIGILLLIAGLLIDREIRARAAADAALRETGRAFTRSCTRFRSSCRSRTRRAASPS